MSPAPVTELALTQPELQDLVSRILREARGRGASQAEAAVSIDAGLSVTVRLGEVETLEYQRDRGLGVTVYFDRRKGSASTADLSAEAVRATVEKACTIARYTAEDEYAGLADAERLAQDTPDLDLHHPWAITPEAAIETATRCEEAARAADPRITNSEGASVSTHEGLRVYGNSHGFVGGYATSRHSVSCSVLAEEAAAMERDYWYDMARDPADIRPVEEIGTTAAARAVRRLGARQISTRKVPVIYPAELARGFLGHFLGAIRGGAQYREASFLLGAAGKKLFPDFVDIAERPHLPKAIASAPFDNEGVATSDRELVAGGILGGYILGSYSARRLGLATTGNAGGIWNLIVRTGSRDLAGLLQDMGTGFLVTELIGQGVNAVTGDYSRGAAGYWIEDGELRYPVNEVTIAGNLKELYPRIVAIGNDVDLRGAVRTGSILVEEMTVAGS